MTIHTCTSCGAEFVIEPYHDQDERRFNTCHVCYREILRILTPVVLDVDLRGFNPHRGLTRIVEASKGDVMMVYDYDFEHQRYLLTAGGWWFWADRSEFHVVHEAALQYVKHYTSRDVGEIMLEDIQRELTELEKDPEVQELMNKKV